MTNHIRFFINDNEITADQFTNVPIPQLGSTVFLRDEPYYVEDTTYSFAETECDFNLIDVHVLST